LGTLAHARDRARARSLPRTPFLRRRLPPPHAAPPSPARTPASYLLHHGISHDGVRRRLVLFSLAAPVGALATFSLLSANLFVYKQEMLALCLLFSGGTFLYVATAHVLPEIQAGALSGGGGDDEHEGHSHGHHGTRLTWTEVWVLVAGVLFPLMLNVGEHGH
jgi:zinc transporter 9